MKKIELLSPAGNFGSLVSAVQNGADSIYFGADKFNARMNSNNFKLDELEKAINYVKLRGVKTHLTLNILIKNNEFDDAIKLVDFVYKAGIDALIIQDIGLATKIHEIYPDIELHSSTQMTNYDLSGVEKMKDLGFKRVVLARELNLNQIKEITKKTDLDIEIFGHGALCICYSGECLMSSLIGGRSGNRGKCAGTCRLPYELIDRNSNKTFEKGYLLSSKDVCTLDILPEIIESGVCSIKLEGRMKSPDYVGTITSIYRKYIDLYYSKKSYKVENVDRVKLLQIFNRGGFSTGYLKGKLGRDMMYTKKPNHIGIYIGQVLSYNHNKGYVKFKTEKEIDLGDSISINDFSCKISELMIDKDNIKEANEGSFITVGRIKGNIKPGDKIYKTVSIKLQKDLTQVLRKENRKRKIDFEISREEKSINLKATDLKSSFSVIKPIEVEESQLPLQTERIKEQLLKTGNTVFEVNNISLQNEDEIKLKISSLNELRRYCLTELESMIINSFKRQSSKSSSIEYKDESYNPKNKNVSILLNKIDNKTNYSFLKNVDKVYLPIKLFNNEFNIKKLKQLILDFDAYLYLPAVTYTYYLNFIEKILDKFNFKGVVVSNLGQLDIIKNKDLNLIANYNLNLSNNFSVEEIKNQGFKTYTVSPELDKNTIQSLSNEIEKEVIVYGRSLMMNTEYCIIGKYINCDKKCQNGKYVLKDRMGFEFPIETDTRNCNNYIYNSKITSIKWDDLNVDSVRIDIFDENEEEIIKIINNVKNNKRFEGQEYTSGNLNREI